METPDDLPTSPPPSVSLTRDLIDRRVPHILAIYAGASWGLVEFTAFATDEFLLSPHWTRMVLLTLLMMLPSVFMLAWYHGKPGRDRDSPARTEKIGIPANLALCVVVLFALFGEEDLGSATTSITVETEEGGTVEREVPKTEFRKTTTMFPLDLGPGIAEDESWISYAVPEALALDLMADDFFVPTRTFGYESYARERGFDSFTAAPLSLKRALAQELYTEFMAVGEIDRMDHMLRVTLRLYRVDNGSPAGETVHEGTDFLALVDEMSGPVKAALQIPSRPGIEDLPVRERLSENPAAVAAFFKGFYHNFTDRDTEAAIGYLSTATTLDPSFAVAQHTLFRVLQTSGQGKAVAVVPLTLAMENLYRMPERYGFQVKGDYYRLTGEMDRAEALVEMWIELYPNDLNALQTQAEMQVAKRDWEGVLSTLAAIRRVDPLDGSLILLTARAQAQAGNHDQALSLLTEYVERFPGDAFGYSTLADFHRRRGRYDDARTALERAIVLEPLAPDLVKELADLDLDNGRLNEARAGYERLLAQARTPNRRTEALRGLTHYHGRRGEMAEAISAIEARLQEEAGFRTPREIASGRIDDVFVYLDAGRVDDAVALLEEWRVVFRASPPIWLSRLAVRVTLAAEGVDAALTAYRHASEVLETRGLEGLRPTHLGDLGLIRDRAGDHAGAAESFQAAIALSPEGSFYRGAGRALRRLGLLDEAEAELREALRLVPADPHALLEMALLMEVRGDIEAAMDHLASALTVWENADDDFEPARDARAKLAELKSRG